MRIRWLWILEMVVLWLCLAFAVFVFLFWPSPFGSVFDIIFRVAG